MPGESKVVDTAEIVSKVNETIVQTIGTMMKPPAPLPQPGSSTGSSSVIHDSFTTSLASQTNLSKLILLAFSNKIYDLLGVFTGKSHP